MFKTINKNDWSGKEVKIIISKETYTLSLYGVCGNPTWEKFKILTSKNKDIITFTAEHSNWKYPLVGGYKDNDIWYAYGAIERHNKCLYTAVAQVLFNAL